MYTTDDSCSPLEKKLPVKVLCAYGLLRADVKSISSCWVQPALISSPGFLPVALLGGLLQNGKSACDCQTWAVSQLVMASSSLAMQRDARGPLSLSAHFLFLAPLSEPLWFLMLLKCEQGAQCCWTFTLGSHWAFQGQKLTSHILEEAEPLTCILKPWDKCD